MFVYVLDFGNSIKDSSFENLDVVSIYYVIIVTMERLPIKIIEGKCIDCYI